MGRIEKINSLLLSELANLINTEIDLNNGLITVSYVDCAPDLRSAKIGISVLPDTLTGTALRLLQRSSKIFSQHLKKKLNLKFIPYFRWIVDPREKNAAKIERLINQINV